MQRNTITLEHPTDWQGFRTAARALVQAHVPPQAVDWRCQADAAEDLFAPEAAREMSWRWLAFLSERRRAA